MEKITQCPVCEKEDCLVEIHEDIRVEIRGETIHETMNGYRCKICDSEFEPPGEDYLDRAYRKYRNIKNWHQPEALINLREVILGLSQKEFGDLLGMDEQLIRIYENGGLQSYTHELLFNLLKLYPSSIETARRMFECFKEKE